MKMPYVMKRIILNFRIVLSRTFVGSFKKDPFWSSLVRYLTSNFKYTGNFKYTWKLFQVFLKL